MLNVIVKDLMEYVDIEESMINENTQPAVDLQLNSYDLHLPGWQTRR